MNEQKITLDCKKFEESCSEVERLWDVGGLANSMYSEFGLEAMAKYLTNLGHNVQVTNREDLG